MKRSGAYLCGFLNIIMPWTRHVRAVAISYVALDAANEWVTLLGG